ncbi:hypothetical protein [Leifsonia sp. A12D58]|uniref:hypothetical protein n=1 Tax=Leifsonia sp. A12D58 TaxID=3397674 RepID=UPI0039E0C8F1
MTPTRARIAGAITAAMGLAMMTVPLAANAVEAAAHPVFVTVSINNGTDAAALAGVHIVVRQAEGDDTVVATGVTGADGTLDLEVEGVETSYVADAEWPGAPGDLEHTTTRTEFSLGSGTPVDITLWGTYGMVSGSVTATADGAPLTDLSGAAAVITSGGTTVQRISLAADGSFVSGALPTSASADYRVSFAPPTGYDVAAKQSTANSPFALPGGGTSPATIAIQRQFDVVSHGTTPTPTSPPTPTPTPTVTPTPTPTATPTPAAPTPTSGLPITFGDAVSLGAALDGSSEPQLMALLAALRAETVAGGNLPIMVNNSLGQVLGFVQQPTAPQAPQLGGLVSSVTAMFPGITVNGIAFAAMDLDAALASIQRDRASLLNTQLAAQIADVQARNSGIASVNAAQSALTAYLASPTEAAFTAARNALKAAGVEHAFLSATAGTGAASASALATNLRGQIDSMSNSQQMDMLRLQSLANKRNEAFDVMTDLAKKMRESSSSIIANMRSTPVALGTVQWDSGAVTGSLDLTGVPNGDHHLILTFADAGVTLVANVSVQRGELAATGSQLTPAMGLGFGLLMLGCAGVIGAQLLRRRDVTAMRP